MVAICTGPAFSTDAAGNLVLAGERRKASNSPCALKDGNGLYTDPNGGVFVPDQLSLTQYNVASYSPNTQISGQSTVPFQQLTQNYTNATCWPLQVVVQCTFGIWTYINTGGFQWWECGWQTNGTNLSWGGVIGSQSFNGIPGWLNYMDWFDSHTIPVAFLRLEPHSTQSVSVGSRVTNRWGSGTLVTGSYRLHAWGWTVA